MFRKPEDKKSQLNISVSKCSFPSNGETIYWILRQNVQLKVSNRKNLCIYLSQTMKSTYHCKKNCPSMVLTELACVLCLLAVKQDLTRNPFSELGLDISIFIYISMHTSSFGSSINGQGEKDKGPLWAEDAIGWFAGSIARPVGHLPGRGRPHLATPFFGQRDPYFTLDWVSKPSSLLFTICSMLPCMQSNVENGQNNCEDEHILSAGK